MTKLRLSGILLITSFVSSLIFVPLVNATAPANKVLKGFQSFLKDAEVNYENSLSNLTSSYKANIAVREALILAAKKDFLSFNKIKVVRLGDNRNYWGNFNCPSTRPSCIDVDKGPKFEVGEITSMKDVIAENPAYLDEIDLIVRIGLIELQNPMEYQKASNTIRTEVKAVALATAKYNSDKLMLDNSYAEVKKVEPAILAAKRAAKNLKEFDKAFVIALEFEYNKERLDELASLPFRYINSLKALDSAVKVTKLSNSADLVAERYTMSGALSINRTCGTTFIREPEFKERFSRIAKVYLDITGKTIKQ